MKTLRVGLVGAGFMGEFHARAYAALGRLYSELPIRLELAAVADVREEIARSFAERWGLERWTTDWQSIVADPGLAVIDICTPPALHRDVAVAASEMGHAVYCEKPVGRSAAETAQIAAAIRAAGVIGFVGFNYRWIPAISLARQLIGEGAIGDLVHVRIAKDSDSAANPARQDWRFFASEAGAGSLADVGSHVFDMARSLAGDVAEVTGLTKTVITERIFQGKLRTVDTDDLWMALALFKNGATGSFQGSRVLNGNKADFRVEIAGTRGAVAWEQRRMNELDLHQARDDGLDGFTTIRLGPQHPDHAHFVPVRGHSIAFGDLKVIELSRLAAALTGDGPAVPGFDDALAVARIIEAVPERRWVSVG
jgi:predicted dehydrogenase